MNFRKSLLFKGADKYFDNLDLKIRFYDGIRVGKVLYTKKRDYR